MQSLITRELSFTLAPATDQPVHPITPSYNSQQQDSPFVGGSKNTGATTETISADETIPVFMVGVASSVMLCAVFLYITDVRDRYRHERMLEEHHQRRGHDINSKQMETIASSGYWVPEPNHMNCPYPMLPPMDDDDRHDQPEFVEEISLSPVSTMTASLAVDSLRHVDSEELEMSVEIIELSDEYRVSQDMDIASFVDLSRIQTRMVVPFDNAEDGSEDAPSYRSITAFEDTIIDDNSDYSISMMEDDTDYGMEDDEDESGWTSSPGRSDTSSEVSIGTYLKSIHSSKSHGSTSSSTNSPELLGERCLEEVTPQKSTSDDTSLDRSPDTPLGDQPYGSTQNEMAQLEQLYSKSELPFQEYTDMAQSGQSEEDSMQDYVRNIYFVPVVATRVNFGIEVEDASCPLSYPTVAAVKEKSPLLDRIFVGDLILAINNEGTVGLCASDVTKRFITGEDGEEEGPGQTHIVKLTVMSSQPDGSDSDSSSSIESIDTGRSETAVEV
jgi:hypothetical protein